MDSLNYSYVMGTNRLDHVSDSVPAGNYTEDIDNQTAGNYDYDAIGNLIKDNAEGITSISWTVYGKIRQIVKGDSVVISYTYDPGGNRISKAIIKSGSTDTSRTWYTRDAQGNVMSVYEAGRPAVNDGHLTQSELHLYGSSRIGLLRRNFDVAEEYNPQDTTMPLLGTGLSNNFGRGNKLFELSNHLGNVLVTVNDKKLGVSSNNNSVDYFNPQVVSAQDYYPFGMLQRGRVFNSSGYRFGFNGKENDNEVKGEGSQQDYGMRIYDPRLGKFLSVDPLTKDYPWYTPYQFAGNKPIWAIDLDGLEEYYSNTGEYLGHGKDQKNNELRMATKYEPQKDNDGNVIKDKYLIFNSKKITFVDPSKDLQKLYSDAQRAGGVNGKERAGYFVLDANNAIVYFKRAAIEINNTTNSSQDDPTKDFNGAKYLYGKVNHVVIGEIHTHQSEPNMIGKRGQNGPNGPIVTITDQNSFTNQYRDPGSDGNMAVSRKLNIFNIGYNVDFHSSRGRKNSINNITSRKNLFNGTFSILEFALKKNAESK